MKVGDKVRVLSDTGHIFPIGAECVLVDQDSSSLPYCIRRDSLYAWVKTYQIELIGPKMKVGDKVRVLDIDTSTHCFEPGEIGEIVDTNRGYTVRVYNLSHWMHEDQIELVGPKTYDIDNRPTLLRVGDYVILDGDKHEVCRSHLNNIGKNNTVIFTSLGVDRKEYAWNSKGDWPTSNDMTKQTALVNKIFADLWKKGKGTSDLDKFLENLNKTDDQRAKEDKDYQFEDAKADLAEVLRQSARELSKLERKEAALMSQYPHSVTLQQLIDNRNASKNLQADITQVKQIAKIWGLDS